ncbi:hypothetical protein [Vibrio crassostreae]|uniref:hypothetical protein n=1 Tax=Vibrio crassostreae TaxID=246167 RepID=UPI001B308F44|nr:hypothetical protein [Vibrio crassostreae]
MNIDDLHLLCSIETGFMKDIESNSKLTNKAFGKSTVKKVTAAILLQKPNAYPQVTRLLCLMSLVQFQKTMALAIRKDAKAVTTYLEFVYKKSTPYCDKLEKKVNFVVMHALLKNTLVDVNVVELKKTIKAYE